MICPHCGTDCPDTHRFCKNCGSTLENSAPVSVETPIAEPVKSAPAGFAAARKVKELASSPLFLVFTIALTLQLVCSLISNLTSELGPFSSLMYNSYSYGYYSYNDDIMALMLVILFVAMIPSLLMVLGSWLTYGFSRNTDSPTMRTTGLSMIKGVLIFSLVMICIMAGIVEIGFFAAFANAVSSYYLEDTIPVIFLAWLLATAVMVLLILYYAKLIQSVNTAKNTLITGRSAGSASGFAAVFTLILVTLSIIGFIGNIALSLEIEYFDFFGTLSSFSSIVTSITGAVLIFAYNRKMDDLRYESTPLHTEYMYR